jgi:hypothetical protein
MFVHDIPRRLVGQTKIFLHPTLLAPLGIARGSKLNAGLRFRNSWDVPELVLTPYDYAVWPDIWNLEMQLIDKPGQLQRIFTILEKNSIKVLHFIARTAYKSRYHSKYFILDCSAYDKSTIDERPTLRHEVPEYKLSGLYYNILTEFLHEIRINYDNTPRITLNRNILHLNMWQDTLHKSADGTTNILDIPVKVTLDRTGLSLSQDFIKHLKVDTGTYFVTSANIKDHVIYCGVLNEANAHIVHFVIYFDRSRTDVSHIMRALQGLHLNIVRSQLAQGIMGMPKVSPLWLRASPDIVTLNVMALSKVPVRREELILKLNSDSFFHAASKDAFHVAVMAQWVENLDIALSYDEVQSNVSRRVSELQEKWQNRSSAEYSGEYDLEKRVKLAWTVRREIREKLTQRGLIARNGQKLQRGDSAYSMFFSRHFDYDKAQEIADFVVAQCDQLNINVVGPGGGFGPPISEFVLSDVRIGIRACETLLAVLTPRDAEESNIWIVSEVAMALALNIPVALAVHRGARPEQWQRLGGGYREYKWDESDFESKIGQAIRELDAWLMNKIASSS